MERESYLWASGTSVRKINESAVLQFPGKNIRILLLFCHALETLNECVEPSWWLGNMFLLQVGWSLGRVALFSRCRHAVAPEHVLPGKIVLMVGYRAETGSGRGVGRSDFLLLR